MFYDASVVSRWRLSKPLLTEGIIEVVKVLRLRGRVVSNVIGAMLDKLMPLLIAVLLTQHMSNRDFGLWSQLLQVALICNAILLSTNAVFFGRDQKEQNDRLPVYNFPIAILSFCVLCVAYVFWFPSLNDACPVWLLIPFLILFSLYSYHNLYLRFQSRDWLYVIAAASRIVAFILLAFFFVLAFGDVALHWLVLGLVIAHLPAGICAVRVIQIQWKVDKTMLSEYFQLMMYGFLTVLFSGIDRFVTETSGYTYEQLGIYCYAATFAAAPSFLVEGFKRYHLPIIYRDYNSGRRLTSITRQKIKIAVFLVVIAQLFAPLMLYITLNAVGMVPASYVGNASPVGVIFLLSVALCIHNMYHFINPWLLYFQKSYILSVSQIMAVATYLLIVMMPVQLTDARLASAKIAMAGVLVSIPMMFLICRVLRRNHDPRGIRSISTNVCG